MNSSSSFEQGFTSTLLKNVIKEYSDVTGINVKITVSFDCYQLSTQKKPDKTFFSEKAIVKYLQDEIKNNVSKKSM